jgi:hypothetical protein
MIPMPTFTETQQIVESNTALAGLAILDRAAAAAQAGWIEQALDAIFQSLQDVRENMAPADWDAFARYVREEHPLAAVLAQDPFTARALEKPRGYAGDAVMMDYLYGIHHSHLADAQATRAGREIHGYIQRNPAGQAVCWRRRHIAELIDRMAANGCRPDVLSIAAGHLREAELSEALAAGRAGRFVAMDADRESLREVAANYGAMGVETVHASVRHLLARKLHLGTFDFVYAAGLFDYLSDNVARALMARMFELTRPGGQLLIPNFAPHVLDRGYMETFMDWRLIYRDEYDMAMLAANLDAAVVESSEIYCDPGGSVVYLMVKKVG